MSKPPNQDTEVDKALDDLIDTFLVEAWNCGANHVAYDPTNAKSALNNHFKSILLEVIGEDKPCPKDCHNWLMSTCHRVQENQLRAELRQRLESRLG
jgi:hypothetical protein